MNKSHLLGAVCASILVLSIPAIAAPVLLVPNSNQPISNSQSRVNSFHGITGHPVGVFIGPFEVGGELTNDLDIGPDRNVYVSIFNFLTRTDGRIDRFDGKTGAFIDTFIAPGSGGLFNASQLTFGGDGNLYVLNRNAPDGDYVNRYDGKTGAFLDRFIDGLTSPGDFCFGPDDNIYVVENPIIGPDRFARVKRYDGMTGALIDVFVSLGSGGIITGNRLVFGPNGDLYISAFFNSGVMRYDGTTGEFIELIETIDSPIDFGFRPKGDLIVSERTTGPDPVTAVRRYNIVTGAYIDDLVSPGSGETNLPRRGLTFTRLPIPVDVSVDKP